MRRNAGEATDWREKYFRELDERERVERACGEQQQSLRRAIVRVSLAADGLDAELDTVLGHLRDRLRKPDGGNLKGQLQEVEASVLSFDRRRRHRGQVTLTALQSITDQLQQLDLPRAVSKGLKVYRRSLSTRVEQLQEMPSLLAELSNLQRTAIACLLSEEADSRHPAEGRKPVAQEAGAEAGLPEHASPASPPPVHPDLVTEVAEGAEAAAPLRTFHDLANVLTDLLDQLRATPGAEKTVAQARQRIQRGLEWDELLPTLVEIRDLVMQAHSAADGEFVAYLDSVSQELANIYAVLGGAVTQEATARVASERLQSSIHTQMEFLHKAVQSSTDVEQLKIQVTSQIEFIREALADYRQAESANGPLETLLSTLVQQVQKMESAAEKSQQSFAEQRRKALQDPLTKLPNRQAFTERVQHELERWQRYGHSLTLAVGDIDWFKRINDSYGHQAGDRVLQTIAQAISERLRTVDFLARYGGEEFVILMPETDVREAVETLDGTRAFLAEMPFRFKQESVQVTVSFGVAAFTQDDTAESVFERADRALYEAKNGGRNRCCFA